MFKTKKTGKTLSGKVIYRKNEYSFDFIPTRNCDIYLMIGFLHLGIDSKTMLAQQVWGYNHSAGWLKKKLRVPKYFAGELILDEEIQSGIAKSLVEDGQWTTSYDSETNWICIGDDNSKQNEIAVEFTTNTIAVLNNGNLTAIWLKPLFV